MKNNTIIAISSYITFLTIGTMFVFLCPKNENNSFIVLYAFFCFIYSLIYTKTITLNFGTLNVAITFFSCYFSWVFLHDNLENFKNAESIYCLVLYILCASLSYTIGHILNETLKYVFGIKKTGENKQEDKQEGKQEGAILELNESELRAIIEECVIKENYEEAAKIRDILNKKFGKNI